MTDTVLFRTILGEVLRRERMQRGFTLRGMSKQALVSPGYISEIERGTKEASSELLGSLCRALDVPLSDVLRDVSDVAAAREAEQAAPTLVATSRLPRRDGDVVASAA